MNIAIILNYRDFARTIQSADRALESGIDRVVIVDNSSPNNSFEKLKERYTYEDDVFVIQTKTNSGYAKGNNWGLQFAEKKFGLSSDNVIFIVNPDSETNQYIVNSISKFIHATPNAGAVSGLMNNSNKGAWKEITPFRAFVFNILIIKWILLKFGISESIKYPLSYLEGDSAEVDVIVGALFGIRQDLFNKVGYFDEETFLYYEEEILHIKLKSIGVQNFVLPNTKFIHRGGGDSVVGKVKFKVYNDQSRLYLLKKYYHVSNVYILATKAVNVIDNFIYNIRR